MGRGVLKAFLGVTAFMVFIGFLFFEIIANGGTSTSSATRAVVSVRTSTVRNSIHFQPLPKGGPAIHPNLDPNFVSKRRVPNGPDPIHNRRAGKSRQPPGRA